MKRSFRGHPPDRVNGKMSEIKREILRLRERHQALLAKANYLALQYLRIDGGDDEPQGGSTSEISE